jgi:bud site selection protein 20
LSTLADQPIFTHRVRILREEPHSQKIAEAAVGLGVADNVKRSEDDNVEMKD